MLNRITVVGWLISNPELTQTPSGISKCRFTLASERDFKSKGSDERETDFIDCVAWRSEAAFISKYFAKGRMAVVDGRLQIRPYTDKEGNKRRAAEIVVSSAYFGDSKPKSAGSDKPPAYQGSEDDIPDEFKPDLDGNEDDGNLPF